jgi:transmembrane sensor
MMAMAASVALLLSIGGGWAWLNRTPVYETSIGAQESVVLEDGTRVTLNTDSRISILYSERERRVRLDRGEALFEVHRDPAHPFIVEAQGDQIMALGTTFVVRRNARRVAVTLLEGKVEVTRTAPAGRARVAVLTPGQRVTMVPEAGATIDRPSLDAVTAWRRGAIIFTGTSLINATGEINRYGKLHVIVDDPAIAELPVSGVFATSDAAEFAEAVAEAHALRVKREGESLRLSR